MNLDILELIHHSGPNVKETICMQFPRIAGPLLVLGVVLLWSCAYVNPLYAEDAFSFTTLAAIAETLAQQEYSAPTPLPEILSQLNYDEWRSIRQRSDKALWSETEFPFNLQFFHPGSVYDRSVKINLIEAGQSSYLNIERDWFDYGGMAIAPQIPEVTGAAGFRVHYPLKQDDYLDEFLVFLGGSYLRAVGKQNNYGLSVRGLALDTASSQGEEFPWFREFWIETPQAEDTQIVIYALLDSPSVTGAYRFVATPGEEAVIDVTSRVYFRQAVEKVGIAPLTSMYFYGENDRLPGVRDFRPEVHDSDGLQIAFGSGEWLWRPLNNPKYLQVNSFNATDIKGFGLMQRDLAFSSYEDLEANYHARPSLWIEPTSNWGAGHVELVQIPTKDEVNDNVVAYWVPVVKPQVGEAWDFSYRMRWSGATVYQPPGTQVVATRTGLDQAGVRRFVIDFAGDKFGTVADISANVSAAEGGSIRNVTVQKNDINQTIRLSFELEVEPVSALDKVLPDNGSVIELRAFLTQGVDVVSETWSYSAARKPKL
jgi:glucans biosynthesis protein